MDDRYARVHRMHRSVGVRIGLVLLCVLLSVGRVLAKVPYTPTWLLYSSQHNGSFAYLLRPAENNPGRTEFVSLNISGDIDTANPPYTVLQEETPFRHDGDSSAYIPAVDQYGVVSVYTGDCQGAGKKPILWQFTPDPKSLTGNGTWEQHSVQGTGGQLTSVAYGPNYLSPGFTYSASNTTASSFYAFAGMCPSSSNDSADWIAAANYSQSMIVLDPLASDNISSYQASITGDRAPPIPEAGLTITPLRATYAYSDEQLRQQQDFLLIGGHTQRAFLNMSELAIFSTPQNSWSFVTVESSLKTQQTELAVRDAPAIEPRSGHTAVLSPDGNKVIVFGGWVGNTTVPAIPQLAILEIGGGFAGSGAWMWKAISTETAGIPEGTGIYGHGAMMLPGGVMMITGGYRISQSTKRSGNGLQLNSNVYLYNVESNSWDTSYENPFTVTPEQTADTSASTESRVAAARKAGLGVGLGLGIPAVAGAAIFIFLFSRKHGVRQTRNKELRKLALGAERPHYWGREEPYMASSIRKPGMTENPVSGDYPWSNNRSAGKRPNWRDNGDAVAERTGLLGENSSPPKLNRPKLNSRMYQPPAHYHEIRRSDATGDIHPIEEGDEDEARGVEKLGPHETIEPFAKDPLFTQETQGEELRPPVLSSGPSKLAEEVALEEEQCSLPEKSDRTSSNLSDSSSISKSSKSSKSLQFPRDSLRHSGRQSPNKPPPFFSHNREATRSQDSATASISYEKRYSSDSYSTAHTTLSQRFAEGENLLQPDSPEPSSFLDLFPRPMSHSRPRASEWIGSVRRVLSVTRKRHAADHDLKPNSASLASGIDGRHPVVGNHERARVPQRSVSASAELFRRKQGARDWGADLRSSREETGFHTARSTRDDFGLDGTMDLESDEDWDVEGAAEGRRVQVTFTVPKEKLRVVNPTANDLDDLSEKSISRSNSAS